MADNYMQFSEQISGLTPEAAEWVETVLGFESENFEDEDQARAALADLLGRKTEDLVDIDMDYWPCFDWTVDGAEKSSLWLRDNGEHFNTDDVMLFVQSLITKWMPAYIFSMTWAGTCSKQRIGEFGGGWIVVTRDEVDYEDSWSGAAAKEKEIKDRRCPHGNKLGDCTPCDVAGDLAYDSMRENRP